MLCHTRVNLREKYSDVKNNLRNFLDPKSFSEALARLYPFFPVLSGFLRFSPLPFICRSRDSDFVEDERNGFPGNLHRDGSEVAEPVEDGEQLERDQPVARPVEQVSGVVEPE